MSPLEKKLSQGRLRPLPSAWRDAILAQAAASAEPPRSAETSRPKTAHPSRFWWGLAAVWALLLAAQIDGTSEDARLAARLGPVSESGWARHWQQRREIRRLSETLLAQIDQAFRPVMLSRPAGAAAPLESHKITLP